METIKKGLMAMGEQLINSHQFVLAEPVFFRLTTLNAQDPYAWLGLGLAMQGQNKLNAALQCFVSASVYGPDWPKPAFCAAQVLCQLNRPAQALQAVLTAERRTNNESTPVSLRADIKYLKHCLAENLGETM